MFLSGSSTLEVQFCLNSKNLRVYSVARVGLDRVLYKCITLWVSLFRKLRHLPEASPATVPGPAPLDILRARMSALLQSPSPLLEPEVQRTTTRTPSFFTRAETSCGALLSRREVFGPDYTMPGREKIALAPASRAEASLLALLALDPALSTVDFSKALFLDTETTGLSGGTGTVAFLLGLGFFESDTFVVEQILVEDLGEESPMLAHLCERFRGREVVVTFNGKSFDWPLLKTRLALAKMDVPAGFGHVDLLHVARRVHTAWGVERTQREHPFSQARAAFLAAANQSSCH
jgi:uncharacterized protein